MTARMVYDERAAVVRVAWSFLGPPPKLPRQLTCCLRLRESGGFDNTSVKLFREHRGVEVQLRGVAGHRLQRLLQRLIVKVLVPQRVALVPGVRDEVLSGDASGCRPRHQVHVPLVEVVQGLQGLQQRESNRNEHVEPESQIPSLVKDLCGDTLKAHCTR